MSMTNLEWLRKLVEDEPVTELESAVASGTETDFFVQNPPITTGTVAVSVDGVAQTDPADYTVLNGRVIRFVTAPATDSNVVISYARQTFTDAELETYLAAAGQDWDSPAAIYQAAIYAIDSLLMGAATALDFGAGAETFGMSSVFQRMMQLRAAYIEALETGIAPALIISELTYGDSDYVNPGEVNENRLPVIRRY